MKGTEKFALVAGAVSGIVAYTQYRKIAHGEQAKRDKIKVDTAAQLVAIHRAAAVVQDRIRRGEYNAKGYKAAMDDFEFEQIVQHPEL